MAPAILEELVERISSAEGLDKVGKPLANAVAIAVPHGVLKDALSGTWLGHPLHPLLTDLPIGAWTSAFVLDLVGGKRARPAADSLIGFGIVTALPTAAAGLSDWSDLLGEERRVGVAHAAGNTGALVCYTASYVARRRGHRIRGLAWSFAGAAAATAGAYLGGHLSFRRGVNVDRNAWTEVPGEWQVVVDEAELASGKPVVARAGDVDVVLVKRGSEVLAIGEVCGHAGGPLHEGEFDEVDGRLCVTCPWHQSTFHLDDGSAVHGPATGPQPAFETRVEGGKVSVRARRQP